MNGQVRLFKKKGMWCVSDTCWLSGIEQPSSTNLTLGEAEEINTHCVHASHIYHILTVVLKVRFTETGPACGKCILLKLYSVLSYNKCIQWCDHQHHQDTKYFHLTLKTPHTML